MHNHFARCMETGTFIVIDREEAFGRVGVKIMEFSPDVSMCRLDNGAWQMTPKPLKSKFEAEYRPCFIRIELEKAKLNPLTLKEAPIRMAVGM